MTGRHDEDPRRIEDHPALPCWYCERPTPLAAVLDKGIIVSREDRLGGPYRIFTCPYCLHDWMCERTPRGRWFASPNVRLGLLDYLLTYTESLVSREQASRDLLQAIAWFRDNEARRRYYFERDGDRRYSGESFLKWLWPWGRSEEPTAARDAPGAGSPRGDDRQRDRAARERARERERERRSRQRDERSRQERRYGSEQQREEESPPRRARPSIPTPHEILGVDEDASLEEIQRRFHRLAVQYHPDKVHHLGEEFRQEAHRRFVALQRAYRVLRSRHGARRG